MECNCVTFQDIYIGFLIIIFLVLIFISGYSWRGTKDD